MMTLFLINICAAACLGAPPSTVNMRALIERALNEPAAITLEAEKLGDAIRLLSEQTGVKIVMPDEVMNLVPNGPDTVVQKVEIAHLPLRQALSKLFSPLGMTFVVRDDHVEIVPKQAILCLGRPPTWTELDTLATLSDMQPGMDDDALAKLESLIQFHVTVPHAWTLLAEAIRNVGAGPGDEVLTVACANLAWAWCLSGERIVVTAAAERVVRSLQQPISLRLNNRPLFSVLQALAQSVNVDIRAEPGALASLPMHVQRNFSINTHQQTAEQVLETIAAYTGLGYLIEPDGVLFYRVVQGGEHAPADDKPPSTVSLADPYVAKMVVPLEDGKSIEWLIRLSELPEDLRQMRERDLAEAFRELRMSIGEPE